MPVRGIERHRRAVQIRHVLAPDDRSSLIERNLPKVRAGRVGVHGEHVLVVHEHELLRIERGQRFVRRADMERRRLFVLGIALLLGSNPAPVGREHQA